MPSETEIWNVIKSLLSRSLTLWIIEKLNFCQAEQILYANLCLSPLPLFITDNMKVDGIPTKLNKKIHNCFRLYFKF